MNYFIPNLTRVPLCFHVGVQIFQQYESILLIIEQVNWLQLFDVNKVIMTPEKEHLIVKIYIYFVSNFITKYFN